VLTKAGVSAEILYIFIFVWTFILLLNNLLVHQKLDIPGVIVSLLCTIFITLMTFAFESFGIFVMPAVTTIAFYLIISLWNLRFSGMIKTSDYISPFVFALFAILVILYL
jgi:hypothetical protein